MSPDQALAVTNRIARAIENGTPPWRRPWKSDSKLGPHWDSFQPPRQWNGRLYSGINVLNLWILGDFRGFKSPYWLTYRRAAALGAQVRKGAKSELSFFARRIQFKAKDPDSDPKAIYMLRAYPVFNADEVDGLPTRFYATEAAMPEILADSPPFTACPAADAAITATGATIIEGGSRAYYSPSTDRIHLPPRANFESAPAYYETAFHELSHWTGHPTRLDRAQGKVFADSAYAAEELVAEISAAICLAEFSLATPETETQNAAYAGGWLKAMRNDPQWIFRVASAASRAASFIVGKQEAEESEDPSTGGDPANTSAATMETENA